MSSPDRVCRLSIAAAFLAAISFGLGGYLGTQIEHVNQLQGLAWIGWMFLGLRIVARVRNQEFRQFGICSMDAASAVDQRCNCWPVIRSRSSSRWLVWAVMRCGNC